MQPIPGGPSETPHATAAGESPKPSLAAEIYGETAPGVSRFSASTLLGAILLFFVTTPIVDRGRAGEAIEAVGLSIVLLCGVLAVGARRRTLVIASLLVVPAAAAKWIELLSPQLAVPGFLVPVLSVAATTFVAIELLRFVMRSPLVTHETVSAAISAYLVMGMAWGFAYLMVARGNPAAFAIANESGPPAPLDGFTAFYFSFITLLTIGYGDIAPVSKSARMLAICEGLAGTLFVVTILGRLVAMYRPQERPTKRGDGRKPPHSLP